MVTSESMVCFKASHEDRKAVYLRDCVTLQMKIYRLRAGKLQQARQSGAVLALWFSKEPKREKEQLKKRNC
jgi:hypothetical protein